MMSGMGRAELPELGPYRVILSLPAVDTDDLVAACEVLWQEGHRVWALPFDRLDELEALAAVFGRRAALGVFGLADPDDTATAVAAGASWLASQHPLAAVVEAAGDVPVVLGGLTPSELRLAHEAGASAVQVVPADAFGSSYARALPPLLDDIDLIATGRLEYYQAELWLASGALAVWHTGLIEPAQVVGADLGSLRSLAQRWQLDG
jgi:2-dehydro-3-deoxyphosphogluconate aldolase/(4S)-4-hydroxy-2-oxoglutarate aldolase